MSFVELCDTLYLPTPKCFPLVEKVSLAIGQNSLKLLQTFVCKCALFFLQKFQAVQNFRGAFFLPIN